MSAIDEMTWFFHGLKPDTIFGNTTSCIYGLTNMSLVWTPGLIANVSNSSSLGWYNQSLIVLKYIQNVSLTLMQCDSLVQNIITYGYMQKEQQNGWTNYLLAFFQNSLSNIVSFINIFKSIELNEQNGNKTGLLYQYGRLIKIIVDVPPINFEALYDKMMTEV